MARPPIRIGSLRIEVFVPSQAGDGSAIDQAHWTEVLLSELAAFFGGATALPPGRGAWRDDANGGQVVVESTRVIYCLADPADFRDREDDFLDLVLQMGQETRQKAVGFIVDDRYYEVPIRPDP